MSEHYLPASLDHSSKAKNLPKGSLLIVSYGNMTNIFLGINAYY
jgi:hypothetical protein